MPDEQISSPPLDPRRPDDAESQPGTDPEGTVDALQERVVPDHPDPVEGFDPDQPAFDIDVDPEEQSDASAGDEPTA